MFGCCIFHGGGSEMFNSSLLLFIFIAVTVIYAANVVFQSKRRSATEVYFDLADDFAESDKDIQQQVKGLRLFTDEFGQMGLIDAEERKKFKFWQVAIPVIVILLLESIVFLLNKQSISVICATCVMGWGIGYIITRWRLKNGITTYQRLLEFNLPLVMERLVMAVEAGLDIVAAMQNIVELEKETQKEALQHGRQYKIDPVTKLLEIVIGLSNAGLRFEKSLYETANIANNNAIKHAFIHLALAQKEGGELIVPLRELSDATQLQYQENLEEEIAKMPVKATLPLVFTFAGLIVFFLTGPIVQIIKITTSAMPK